MPGELIEKFQKKAANGLCQRWRLVLSCEIDNYVNITHGAYNVASGTWSQIVNHNVLINIGPRNIVL